MLSRGVEPHGADTRADAGSDAEAIDPAVLSQLLSELDPSGAARLRQRVVQAFDASIERLLPQLQHARASGDVEAARVAAHTLKSSSASLGAKRLSALCAELERQARTQAVTDLESQADAIIVESHRVRAALARLVGPAA